MDFPTTITLFTAIAALIGSFVAIARLGVDKRSADVNASTGITKVATELIDDLREEIRRLREKVTELENWKREAEIKQTECKNKIMELQLALSQSRERITALETETELRGNGNEG